MSKTPETDAFMLENGHESFRGHGIRHREDYPHISKQMRSLETRLAIAVKGLRDIEDGRYLASVPIDEVAADILRRIEEAKHGK